MKIGRIIIIIILGLFCLGLLYYAIYSHYVKNSILTIGEDSCHRLEKEIDEFKDYLSKSTLHWHYHERISELEKKRNTRLDLSKIPNRSTVLVSPGDTLYYFHEVWPSVGHDYSIITDSTILVDSYRKYNSPEEQTVNNCGGDKGERITSIIPLKEGIFTIKVQHRYREKIKNELTYSIEVKGNPIGLTSTVEDSLLPNIWNYISNLERVVDVKHLQNCEYSSGIYDIATIFSDSLFIRNIISRLIPVNWKSNPLIEDNWIKYTYSHNTAYNSLQELCILYPKSQSYPYIVITYFDDNSKNILNE